MKKISCFIACAADELAKRTMEGLEATALVAEIHTVENTYSSVSLKEMAAKSQSPYTLLYTKETVLQLGMFALERMIRIMDDTEAGMIYADH